MMNTMSKLKTYCVCVVHRRATTGAYIVRSIHRRFLGGMELARRSIEQLYILHPKRLFQLRAD